MAPPKTVDDYIAQSDDAVRETLSRLRSALHQAAPDGAEKLRYGMPAVELAPKAWLHFGAWKTHIGVYPVPRLPAGLEERIEPYRTTTSTVNLPLDAIVPVELIGEVARAIAAGAPRD